MSGGKVIRVTGRDFTALPSKNNFFKLIFPGCAGKTTVLDWF